MRAAENPRMKHKALAAVNIVLQIVFIVVIATALLFF